MRTGNTGPGDAAGVAVTELRALGSVVGVGDDIVWLRLEAHIAVAVLQCVHRCASHTPSSAY